MPAILRTWLLPILVLAVISWFAAPHAAEPRQLYVQPSALGQVVAGLRDAPPLAHLDFMTLMLDALIDAYAEELDRSRAEHARDEARARRLVRWRQAMEMELRQLRHFRFRLATAGDVRVSSDRQGQVLLLMDGSPLLVSWPRVSEQARREADLAARFCTLHPCAPLAEAGAARAVEGIGMVRGAWSMSQLDGPGWESESGVRCTFPDLRDRAAREARCRALAADLESLADVLAQVIREGARIDWRALRVEDEPGGGPQRVTVNEHGDFVLLNLSALSVETLDWYAAGRWLERRAGNRRSVETVLSAGP